MFMKRGTMTAVNTTHDISTSVGNFFKVFNRTTPNRPHISLPFKDQFGKGTSRNSSRYHQQSVMLAASPKPKLSRNHVGLVKTTATLARQSERSRRGHTLSPICFVLLPLGSSFHSLVKRSGQDTSKKSHLKHPF